MNEFVQNLGILTLTTILASGCDRPPLRDAERAEFDSVSSPTMVCEAHGKQTLLSNLGLNKDLDGDGDSDIIFSGERVYFVSKEFSEKYPNADYVMTQEVQLAATKALHSNNELSYLMSKQAFKEAN